MEKNKINIIERGTIKGWNVGLFKLPEWKWKEASYIPCYSLLTAVGLKMNWKKNVSVITWHRKAGWVSSIKHSLYINATNKELFAGDITAQATGTSCSNLKQHHLLWENWNCCLYLKCFRSCRCYATLFCTLEFSRFTVTWIDLPFHSKKSIVKVKSYLSYVVE